MNLIYLNNHTSFERINLRLDYQNLSAIDSNKRYAPLGHIINNFVRTWMI